MGKYALIISAIVLGGTACSDGRGKSDTKHAKQTPTPGASSKKTTVKKAPPKKQKKKTKVASLRRTPPPPRPVLVGHDFINEARLLFRVSLCRGNVKPPAVASSEFLRVHCKFMAEQLRAYKKGWLAHARPFFDKLVPKTIGTKIVYPFGGGDLMTGLAVFPRLTEVTTLSLESSGDPRPIHSIDRPTFEKYFKRVRRFIWGYFESNHSRTVDMNESATYGKLPGNLIFSMMALAVFDMEPVSLRYFTFKRNGSIEYLTKKRVAALNRRIKAAKSRVARARVIARQRWLFRNMELQFRKRGTNEPIRIHRHVRADLSDRALRKDGRVLRHLKAKGKVPVLTKAASYLLWGRNFSMIRRYIIKHLEWMVSDATGVPPHYARKAKLEQITYGRFHKHIRTMPNPGQEIIRHFRRLWASQPARPLPFRFGYSGGFKTELWHLMVTRPMAN